MNEYFPMVLGIKEEPVDCSDSTSIFSKEGRQVLVNFGQGRKKVFLLDGRKTLSRQFKSYVKADPAFSNLLNLCFLVFQVFNTKFGTWVEIDSEENLSDGAVVKAVFLPKIIQTNETRTGIIKCKIGDNDKSNDHDSHLPKCRTISYEDINTNNITKIDGNKNEISKELRSINKQPTLQTPVSNITCKGTKQTKRNKNISFKYEQKLKKIEAKEKRRLNKKLQKMAKVKKRSLQNIQKNIIKPKRMQPAKSLEQNQTIMSSERHQVIENTMYLVAQNNFAVTPSEPILPSRAEPVVVDGWYRNPFYHQVFTSNIEPSGWKDNQSEQNICTGNDAAVSYTTYSEAYEPRIFELSFTSQYQSHFEQRLNWGRSNESFTWEKILFSDMTLFYLDLEHKQIIRKPTHGQGEMFWGCVTVDGPKIIVPVGPSLKAKVFVEILQCISTNFLEEDYVYLQMFDHYTQCRANVVKTALTDNSIKFVLWPKCVEEFSPLKLAWDLLGKKVEGLYCSSREEMINIVTQVWAKDLDMQLMCKSFVTSIPEMINSLIKSGGRNVNMTIQWG